MTSRNPSNRISMHWVKDLKDPKAKEDFERQLRNDGVVLGKLKEIIEELMSQLETKELDIEDFDSPSWALKQASRLGEKRGLKTVRDLLLFIDGE